MITTNITINNIEILICKKEVKNIHLAVLPPHALVRITVPLSMEEDRIRRYAISKLAWIIRQQKKMKNFETESQKQYLSGETFFYFGNPYRLKVCITETKERVVFTPPFIELYTKQNTIERKELLLNNWYKRELKKKIPDILQKWESLLKLKVEFYGIKNMKTKWGSCNPVYRRIWINLKIAQQEIECLDYIILHEILHFIERKHNKNFIHLLNIYMPNWRKTL